MSSRPLSKRVTCGFSRQAAGDTRPAKRKLHIMRLGAAVYQCQAMLQSKVQEVEQREAATQKQGGKVTCDAGDCETAYIILDSVD